MKLEAFLRERGPDWEELDRVLRSAQRRPERLGADGIRRLGALYRAASADLARARRSFPHDPVIPRLEDLVVRARTTVYAIEPRRGSLLTFVRRGYWRRVRERPVPLALAWGLLLVSGILAGVWGAHDPAAAAGVLPSALRGAANPQHGSTVLGTGQEAALSSQIFTNNIRVAGLAFAAGIAGGLGTAVVLLYNGVILGVVGGLSISAGQTGRFVELVAPHGVLELSCIAVSAAAGLRIGWAVVAPGRETRAQALAREARRSVEILIGTVPWLVVAGLVEGFVTPSRVGVGPALAIGLGLAAVYWLLVAWRGASARVAAGTADTQPGQHAADRADPRGYGAQSRARALAAR